MEHVPKNNITLEKDDNCSNSGPSLLFYVEMRYFFNTCLTIYRLGCPYWTMEHVPKNNITLEKDDNCSNSGPLLFYVEMRYNSILV